MINAVYLLEEAIGYRIDKRSILRIRDYLYYRFPGQRRLMKVGFSTWNEILEGCIYGTSVLIHEIAEVDTLTRMGFDPLKSYIPPEIFYTAHMKATYQEHLFLQRIAKEDFKIEVNVGALIFENFRYQDEKEMLLIAYPEEFLLSNEELEKAKEFFRKIE